MTAIAEREAADIFSNNLQKLLLAPPVRGKNVLGVDPGFKHGCKIVALDRHGNMASEYDKYKIIFLAFILVA